jgi:hypothetical protein
MYMSLCVSCGSLLAAAFLSNREIGTLVLLHIRYIDVWAWLSLRFLVAVFFLVKLMMFEGGLWLVSQDIT